MHKRDIVVAYVVVAAVLPGAESVLLLSCGIESNVVHRISEVTSFIGPLVASWRFATRMQRGLSDAELLGAAFWCLMAQLTIDIAGTGVAFLTGAFDQFGTFPLTPEMAPTILFAGLLRYLLLYLIVWVSFRFPGRWLARWALRSPDAVA